MGFSNIFCLFIKIYGVICTNPPYRKKLAIISLRSVSVDPMLFFRKSSTLSFICLVQSSLVASENTLSIAFVKPFCRHFQFSSLWYQCYLVDEPKHETRCMVRQERTFPLQKERPNEYRIVSCFFADNFLVLVNHVGDVKRIPD